MTERRHFIRAAFLAAKPKREQFSDALGWARDAWDFLTENGEGAPKAHEPRAAGTDWYAKLDLKSGQRDQFDAFWKAYGLKKGKNEAAMRWHQLGPLSGDVYQRILAAAQAEARQWRDNPPPGQTRIYAQGWLQARRWEDHDALTPALSQGERGPEGGRGPDTLVKRAHQFNELAALKQLHAARPDDTLARQIAALEEKLHGR